MIVTVDGVASNGKMFTVPTGTNVYYYLDDMLGSARVITTSAGAVCYDADFYPFGGERVVADNCGVEQDYKFEGKERDAETGDDNFGARYYSNRLGRWLSADWSSVPAPVPYANLTNPQTLNLYAMVSDNPESFADLDGHDEIKNTGVCEGDKVCSGEGPDLLIEAGEFLRNVTDEDSNGQTEPAAEQKAEDDAAAQKNTAQQQGTIPGTAQPPALQPPKPPADALKLAEYPTRDAAGIEAEKRINPTSIKEDREYAGWLIKNPDGTYSIGHPNPGTENGSDPGPKPNNGGGEYHTHGGPSPGAEVFSPRDKYSLTKTWGVTGYLGTPSGRILRFDPSTQRTTVLAGPD